MSDNVQAVLAFTLTAIAVFVLAALVKQEWLRYALVFVACAVIVAGIGIVARRRQPRPNGGGSG